nr:subtilisin-like protease SBT4.15 [Ipomoea batatas]
MCSFSPLICINNGYLKSVNQDSQMDIWERECMEFIGIGEAELYDKHNQGFLSDKADNPISNLALTIPGDATDGAVKSSESSKDEDLLHQQVCTSMETQGKVIGAQAFSLVNPNNKSTSPADFDGHGTHTSSIVAGSLHQGANLYGLLNGTARGGVPAARIAMYKACDGNLCEDVDILAAFDAAIADGVDIISVSLGATATSYNNDPTAIGSFHAMQKGILTSCSAGNSGLWNTVENVAPWILTVAAASTNRHLETQLQLGDGQTFSGISINLVNTGSVSLINGTQADLSVNCNVGLPDKSKVKDKILYCLASYRQDQIIQGAEAKGIIFSTDDFLDVAFPFRLPATVIKFSEFNDKIGKHINLTMQPTAMINPTKVVNVEEPFVASFSSRGPQNLASNLLKPDISAPGLNILAAFSPLTSISGDVDDTRTSYYNVLSGTSMSCPHVSAVAAYVKSFHPDWSPAIIKSALMTTAKPLRVKDEDEEYAYGAGMVDPTATLNPGLVFDIDEAAYISFLCKIGYNGSRLVQITGNKTNDCSTISLPTGKDGLNYPTINLDVRANLNITNFDGVYHRTAMNVGEGSATYKVQIESPKNLSIEVSPNILLFKNKNEKKSFKVTLSGSYPKDIKGRLSGSIIWSDTIHNVKIPILGEREGLRGGGSWGGWGEEMWRVPVGREGAAARFLDMAFPKATNAIPL